LATSVPGSLNAAHDGWHLKQISAFLDKTKIDSSVKNELRSRNIAQELAA
jgi:hypothetical protein